MLASARMVGLLGDDMGEWYQNDANYDSIQELVEELLVARTEARKAKDWPRADMLRDGFKSAGVKVTDTPDGPVWSVERDEIDSLPLFHAVRLAFGNGDNAELQRQLKQAKRAGVFFADSNQLDVSPAWRGLPDSDFVREKLTDLKNLLVLNS